MALVREHSGPGVQAKMDPTQVQQTGQIFFQRYHIGLRVCVCVCMCMCMCVCVCVCECVCRDCAFRYH